jgi:hypothetical protein
MFFLYIGRFININLLRENMASNKVDLNYDNDPLLSEEKLFINKALNIYALIVKKDDFENNKKGAVLKKCPYVLDEDKKILNAIYRLRDKNYMEVRQLLGDYLKIKRIRKDTLEKWIKQRRYPLPLVRVAFQTLNKDVLKVLKNRKITDFCNKSQIKFPSSLKDISSDFMAYLIGVHMGDGTLNNERWKIADGDMERKNLKYSYKFLNKIRNKIKKIFSVNPKIYKLSRKNAYELIISNKWLCRYFHFVYGMEYNEKKNPEIPALLKDKRHLLFRGLMDSDGSIKNYKVSIGTKHNRLHNILKEILEESKIGFREKTNKTQRKNLFYTLEIKKEFIVKFIKLVGFSHPRKLKEIIKYLNTSSSSMTFSSYINYNPKISSKDFREICEFLRPIRNAGKVRFITKFNKLNERDKKRIINNIRSNFEIKKKPNEKGYINSYKIEKILTKHCIYKKDRMPTKKREIDKIVINLNKIWE